MAKPIMAKATAVWLVDNTTISFKQIADFVGMPMPKRQAQLKGVMLEEWQTKHQSLLELWKSVKDYDLQWSQFIDERKARNLAEKERIELAEIRRIEIEKKLDENKKAIAIERERLKQNQTQRIKQNTNVQPRTKKKSTSTKVESELERRKKAASRLIDN